MSVCVLDTEPPGAPTPHFGMQSTRVVRVRFVLKNDGSQRARSRQTRETGVVIPQRRFARGLTS